MHSSSARVAAPVADVALRIGIVGLALATASVHATLGDALFTLNAIGYTVLAVAMIAPLALFAKIRWLTRLVLVGYAGATIVAWSFVGPRYDTAYVAKGIELVLVALLVVESYHMDGSPVQIARRLAGLAARAIPRRATPGSGLA